MLPCSHSILYHFFERITKWHRAIIIINYLSFSPLFYRPLNIALTFQMASNFYHFSLVFIISCTILQRNIESNINSDAIPAHLKKQIHNIMDEQFCSCTHNKALSIGNIYIILVLDKLSKLPKEVISELSRCFQVLMM